MIVVTLSTDHVRATFSCGDTLLDDYLKKIALQHMEKKISNTFVLLNNKQDGQLLGYYTTTLCDIQPTTQMPEAMRQKHRLPSHAIPAMRLSRLAVDEKSQNKGYGSLLLMHAVERAMKLYQAGYHFVGILVDAKNKRAKGFYEKFGFIAVDNNPLVLFIHIDTILHLSYA